jgi:hypothetical protein
VLERDEAARWPHVKEKGVRPCTAWQGYSAVGGGLGGKAGWRTRGNSAARLVVKTSALSIQVAQRPWRQVAGTAEQGDISFRRGHVGAATCTGEAAAGAAAAAGGGTGCGSGSGGFANGRQRTRSRGGDLGEENPNKWARAETTVPDQWGHKGIRAH